MPSSTTSSRAGSGRLNVQQDRPLGLYGFRFGEGLARLQPSQHAIIFRAFRGFCELFEIGLRSGHQTIFERCGGEGQHDRTSIAAASASRTIRIYDFKSIG
jgi:hypothetical protein